VSGRKGDSKAFGKGQAAFKRGAPKSDNPYHRATSAMDLNWRTWNFGYEWAEKEARVPQENP